MIRASAKNFESVTVVVDPLDYPELIQALRSGEIQRDTRFGLAAKAYAHTAAYDAMVSGYLQGQIAPNAYQETLSLSFNKVQDLRYGENPHQSAAFYQTNPATPNSFAGAEQIQGKPLSYNNIADADAAWQCVCQFDEPACVIVKHANPCGVAVEDNLLSAYQRAFTTDPTSAFGGIIAFNHPLDTETAAAIIEKQFVEVILAPSVNQDARAPLANKPNVRVLQVGSTGSTGTSREIKQVQGGLLIQDADIQCVTEALLKVVTSKQPTPKQLADLLFAWRVAKFVKSNAIVFAKNLMTVGVGAGQMSRVYSTKIAAIKAQDEDLEVVGSVMSSDAFFPFRDGIDAAAEYGIAAIIQPGGSMRDDEVIQAANEHGMAMVFTGERHFRH